MAKSIIVAGGTGLVGSHLLNQLSESTNSYYITALVRKGRSLQLPKTTSLEIDFDRIEDFEKELDGDVAFCCLGTTIKKAGTKQEFKKVDFEYPLRLAKILFRKKCRQFHIITSIDANVNSLFFYNRIKGEVERELMQIGFEGLSIYRPSLLLGERKEQRAGESIAATLSSIAQPALRGRFRKYRAIRAEKVARAMLRHSESDPQGIHILESNKIEEIGQRA